MKSILLNAANDPGWAARYRAALALARAFAGHLRCVQATPFVDTGEGFFAFYPYPEIAAELHEIGRQHRACAEDQLSADGCEWDWQEVMEGEAQALIRWSRLSDITLVSTGAGAEGKPRPEDLSMAGAVTVHALGPILAVPSGLEEFDPLGTALVAWNGSPEAAGALRAALPLLQRANAVRLVTVGKQAFRPPAFTADDAKDYLARHGVVCDVRSWKRQDQTVAATVIDAAAAVGADYIVAGAYGHTRLREAVLGGTTRGLLCEASRPLIMAH